MASKSNNGNLPLGRSKIDASRGVESALSKLSHQVGARTPRQSMTAGSKQLHNGVFLEAPRVRARSSSACILGEYTVDPDDENKVIIRSGWLHAPNKSVLLEPSPMTPTAGHKVWIECPWTATLNDDNVLEAGGELGTHTISTGATMPDNVVPHVDSLTGTLYAPIGAWNDDLAWIREGCGSFTIGFCPRVFSIERG